MSHLHAQFSLSFATFHLDIVMDVPTQGITVVFGPSGCGKTTLLRCLAGLERAPGGYLKLGENIWQDENQGIFLPLSRRPIGYVFQEPRLFPHLRVQDNLLYGWKRTPTPSRQIHIDQVVDVLDLDHLLDRRPVHLSGGEQQRVAIGRALLRNPQLLLMDEPLSSLDPHRKQEILPFIQRLDAEFQIPVIYVSHDVQEIVQLAQRVLFLKAGTIVSSGPVHEVFSHLHLRDLVPASDIGAILDTQVAHHDLEYGLTQLAFPGGQLSVPQQSRRVGESVRVHILAKDVSIVANHPSFQTSVLNVFKAKILDIQPQDSAHPFVDIQLDIGVPLLATITRKSLRTLNLQIGQAVYAQIKTVSLSHTTEQGRLRRAREDP